MMIRTGRAGSPSGLWEAARLYARSGIEITRYASAVLYARRGGASATSGPEGGGVPVLTDLSDWRDFPQRREARYKAVLEMIDEGLQESIIMHDDVGRRRWMMAQTALMADLPVGVER